MSESIKVAERTEAKEGPHQVTSSSLTPNSASKLRTAENKTSAACEEQKLIPNNKKPDIGGNASEVEVKD